MKNLEKIFNLKVFKKYWYMYLFFIVGYFFVFFLLDLGITGLVVEFNIFGITDAALASGVSIPLHYSVLGVFSLWASSIVSRFLSCCFKKWLKVIDEFNAGGAANE